MNQERCPKKLSLGHLVVGDGEPCCIAAEIGQNHNGEMTIAKKLIDMAALCGATVVKFQKRDVDSELSVELRDKPYENENSFGATYGEHRKFLELSWQQHRELQQYAAEKGILYLCTICDLVSIEQMAPLELPAYKVASRDLTNEPLLDALAQLHRPIVLSTGMAGEQQVDEAVAIISGAMTRLLFSSARRSTPVRPSTSTFARCKPIANGMDYWWECRTIRRASSPPLLRLSWELVTLKSTSRCHAPCAGRITPVPWKWKACAGWSTTFARSRWRGEMVRSATRPGWAAQGETGQKPVFQARSCRRRCPPRGRPGTAVPGHGGSLESTRVRCWSPRRCAVAKQTILAVEDFT